MPFPCARLTDMTPTADLIVGPGMPTVLVAGLPVALLGDSVVGPVITGVITMGSPTVNIGGRPVARMTSLVTGVHTITGVPLTSTIMMPCAPTVLIP
jgi:uncharacterized Zn-binding protein involved in type VI secretion